MKLRRKCQERGGKDSENQRCVNEITCEGSSGSASRLGPERKAFSVTRKVRERRLGTEEKLDEVKRVLEREYVNFSTP
jgi:hypothetical protein